MIQKLDKSTSWIESKITIAYNDFEAVYKQAEELYSWADEKDDVIEE